MRRFLAFLLGLSILSAEADPPPYLDGMRALTGKSNRPHIVKMGSEAFERFSGTGSRHLPSYLDPSQEVSYCLLDQPLLQWVGNWAAELAEAARSQSTPTSRFDRMWEARSAYVLAIGDNQDVHGKRQAYEQARSEFYATPIGRDYAFFRVMAYFFRDLRPDESRLNAYFRNYQLRCTESGLVKDLTITPEHRRWAKTALDVVDAHHDDFLVGLMSGFDREVDEATRLRLVYRWEDEIVASYGRDARRQTN